jgi:dephospho-CoA kinase
LGIPLSSSLRIGLTGGIGSGKSTVAALFAKHGALVVDTDLIARQLTEPNGVAIPAIRLAFGVDFVDAAGALVRSRMRELVFSQTGAKKRLEAILHPLTHAEADRQAAVLTAPVVLFDVPLLVEFGQWRDKVDKILVIDCSEATQVERVVQRPGWTLAAAQAVMAQQALRSQRLVCADEVIFNDGITLEQLAAQVSAVWCEWVANRQ